MGFQPRTRSHASIPAAGLVPMYFITAGAGVNPTVKGGAVANVEALVDAGALPFYRVTMPEKFRNSGVYTIHADCELLAIAEDMTVGVGEFVATGPGSPPARTDYQIDVIIRDGGTPTVAAGRRVSLTMVVKT